jgi:hypothetical protein
VGGEGTLEVVERGIACEQNNGRREWNFCSGLDLMKLINDKKFFHLPSFSLLFFEECVYRRVRLSTYTRSRFACTHVNRIKV